jgi:hypothetical protein
MSLPLFLLAAIAAAASPAPPPAADDATWYLITAEDGAVIGHSMQRADRHDGGIDWIEEREIRVQEGNDPPSTTVERSLLRQDSAGRTLSIVDEARTGTSWARVEAHIAGSRAEIARQTNADRHSIVVTLPPDTRFDSGAGLLGDWDPVRRPRLEFDNFSLDAMGTEHVVIALAPNSHPDPAGGFTILRTRYDHGELRSVARLRLDGRRHVTEIVQPMFGESATIRPTMREIALQRAAPYHAVPHAMIASPFRISDEAARGHIRYAFSFREGLAFAIPETAEQRVARTAGGMTVDICAACGPGLPSDPAYLADARLPTAWLQSDRPELRAIAGPIGRQTHLSARRKMELLLQRARPYLYTIDFNGHYSALETIRRRAGDCTEAAVLLAALGRAAGIPTRVANGLVYSRLRYHGVSNAFMPHSWTMAYVDGAWRSFDLALDAFDATHIALTVGDGDARSLQAASQLAGLLRWDRMEEVRARPAS